MKSKAVLAILVGTTISLSACGQAAQSADVTVNEEAISEASADLNDSVTIAESETAKASTSDTKKSSHSGKKSEDSSESSSGTLVYSLSDGESLSGGTYNAENEDESAIGAGGSVTASISGAAIKKTAGDATSADSSSFEGVNAAVRVYDNATVFIGRLHHYS